MRYLILILVILAGCGSTTDRQVQTVETQQVKTGPVVVDTPIGQFVVHPASVTAQREQLEEGTEKKTIDMPDPAPLMQAAVGGSPWFGIIAGVLGLGTAAITAKKAQASGLLSKKIIKAQSAFADDMEAAETDEDVEAVKEKHAAKQKALGIHDALIKARSG